MTCPQTNQPLHLHDESSHEFLSENKKNTHTEKREDEEKKKKESKAGEYVRRMNLVARL